MADTKHNGTDIIFKVGGTAVAGETDCTLTVNGTTIETSSKTVAQWKEFIAGRSEWEVSGNAMLMFDATADTLSATQKALWTAASTGAAVAVELALTADLKFSGSIIVTQWQANAPDNDNAGFSWAGKGAGALVLDEGA